MKFKDYLVEKELTSAEMGKILGKSTNDINKLLDGYFKEFSKKYGPDEAQKLQWTIVDGWIRQLEQTRNVITRDLTKKGLDPMDGF